MINLGFFLRYFVNQAPELHRSHWLSWKQVCGIHALPVSQSTVSLNVSFCLHHFFCLHRFFWATRFLIFIFSLFFVSGPCARLSWPSRQLLSARKSTVLYRIVWQRPLKSTLSTYVNSQPYSLVKYTALKSHRSIQTDDKDFSCKCSSKLSRKNSPPIRNSKLLLTSKYTMNSQLMTINTSVVPKTNTKS